ncbi:MAG TPA: FadR/GntR family transcriptional regulator [Dehalococcoidia bacterium]|nr:FadR/GntR family transcriptional regulator [Dehalococcoidia bacterium]
MVRPLYVTQERLHSIRRRRLHEDIVQQFHTLIRQGKLKHGDRLPSERDLAEQFKVSRSSVREAIRSLELQGLVVSKRGSGTFINADNLDSVLALMTAALKPGGEDLADVFEMRHLLEPPIAALAAQRASSEDVERLRRILEQQRRQIEAGETGVESDTAFHFALASATHNTALVKVVSAVEDILQISRDLSLQEPGRPQRSLASHHEILETIVAGDAERSQRAMEHHLTAVEPGTLIAEAPNHRLAVAGRPPTRSGPAENCSPPGWIVRNQCRE